MRRFGTVWKFETARFGVFLRLERDYGYSYDGDDENGEIQAKLKSGEYVAFDSTVTVEFDGEVIAENHLGGSVYAADDVAEFYTAHRDSPAEYRNTLEQKAAGRVICHYFPSMVAEACQEAREILRKRAVYLRAA